MKIQTQVGSEGPGHHLAGRTSASLSPRGLGTAISTGSHLLHGSKSGTICLINQFLSEGAVGESLNMKNVQ